MSASSFSSRAVAALRRRVAVFSWLVPMVCLAAWLAPWRSWTLELVRHFQLYGMSLLVILAAAGFALKFWKLATLQLAALLALAWPLRHYYAPPPASAEAAAATERGNAFTLVSCNLLSVPREPERVKAALLEADPDVLLLMEFTPEWHGLLRPLLTRYPHQTGEAREGYTGIWLASRLPLENPEVLELDGEDPCVTARLRLPSSRTVAFVGAHPMAPVSPEMFRRAQRQFAALRALRGRCGGGPFVLAGDLNCTPFARTFRDFLSDTGLRDSAEGRGLTSTWFPDLSPGALFGLPIDHVLVSPGVKVLERSAGPRTGSDHVWVLARLAVE